MAKKSQSEGFGNADPGQMQSPLSFQLNGQGTPEHPCGMLPEYPEDKPLMPIPNYSKVASGGGGVAGS